MPMHPKGSRIARVLALLAGVAAVPLASLPARADFDGCLAGIQAQAASAGVSAQTFRSATSGISYDDKVIELSQAQPEFKTPIWDDMAVLVDEERVQDGRAAMRRASRSPSRRPLRRRRHTSRAYGGSSRISARTGQDAARAIPCHPLLFGNRRRDYFRGELIATLRIIDRGDIAPSRLTGSWAGAFGQTQFMPSTYQRLAVDLDGDGRRDVVESAPDALGVDGELPARRRVEHGCLGLRGPVPSGFRWRGRPQEQAAGLPLGGARREPGGWPPALGR